jgi:hypothetical protein
LQGAFVDFQVAEGLKLPQRVQVHCDVLVAADHLGHIGGTLEVVDQLTGRATYTVDPCYLPLPA